MKALTLEGWNTAGYRVIAGQKASGRNAQGLPTFTRDQVRDLDGPLPARAPVNDIMDDVEDL